MGVSPVITLPSGAVHRACPCDSSAAYPPPPCTPVVTFSTSAGTWRQEACSASWASCALACAHAPAACAANGAAARNAMTSTASTAVSTRSEARRSGLRSGRLPRGNPAQPGNPDGTLPDTHDLTSTWAYRRSSYRRGAAYRRTGSYRPAFRDLRPIPGPKIRRPGTIAGSRAAGAGSSLGMEHNEEEADDYAGGNQRLRPDRAHLYPASAGPRGPGGRGGQRHHRRQDPGAPAGIRLHLWPARPAGGHTVPTP